MKRIWSILLTMTVALTLLCPMTAYAATGEGNIDGGGGNLGDATSHGSWNPGNEGVRVTIVRSDDHAVVSTPIDLTNRAPAASIYHFGKVSKLQYTNGFHYPLCREAIPALNQLKPSHELLALMAEITSKPLKVTLQMSR